MTTAQIETIKIVVSVAALIVSLFAIFVAARTAFEVKSRDIAQDRRRLFITSLWDRLTAVRGVNRGNVTSELVMENLNTLELVGICWSANIVDHELIQRAFSD